MSIIYYEKQGGNTMKKSVYSIVLMDDVIDKIDKLAYSHKTSRSNMINQILAKAVSLTTPEKRMNDTFEEIFRIFGDFNDFRLDRQPSEAMMSFKSPLRYKYKPTIKYSLELFRNIYPILGEIKIYTRTQNSELIYYLTKFFEVWSIIEKKYNNNLSYEISDGKYTRKLILQRENPNITNTQVAKSISDYISTTDKAIKIFFSNENNTVTMENLYVQYLKNQPYPI